MTDHAPIREPDQIRQDCATKLRAVQVSEHFQAILGCLLGEDWTTPRLVEMVITTDGHLLGRCDGEAALKAYRAHPKPTLDTHLSPSGEKLGLAAARLRKAFWIATCGFGSQGQATGCGFGRPGVWPSFSRLAIVRLCTP